MKVKVALEPQPEGGYSIFCPAFPGCVSEGDTRDEALENFRDALDGWLAAKMQLTEAPEFAHRGRRDLVEDAL